MPTGMPSTTLSGFPALYRVPDSSAAWRAPSRLRKAKAITAGLECLDSLDTTLEIGARRVGIVAELGDRVVEPQHLMRCRIIGARRRLLVDVRHQISFDVTGSPSSTCPATSKFTNCDCTCWVTA